MQKSMRNRIVGAASAAILAATQTISALPALAAETNTGYVYGTVNLPYADYYYGELNDVAADAEMQLDAEDPTASIRAEGYCDAVTSATNTKSVKYSATYYTENEDGSVTVFGIQNVAVAVPKSLYEDATAAIEAGSACSNQLLNIVGNMTISEDQETVPTEYKILNGDGTLTAMIDANEEITVSDATVTVTTNTKYGNYQLSITGADDYLPDSDNMEGAVITMSDGSKYAMLHVDNLWLRTGEMAWAVEDDFLVHNANVLKYKSFADTVGKTVTSVRYIIRDSADVTITTESYLPVLHSGTVSAETVDVSTGAIPVTLTDLPEDYAAAVEAAKLGTTYADGALTYDAKTAMPGSYAISVTDATGVYASISTNVTLTTEETPATFDAASASLVAADGAEKAAFANYLSNLATVTVNGTAYSASGKGATKIFDTETGAIDLTASSRDAAVFQGDGDYEITVSATGYINDLTFQLTVGDAGLDKGDIDQNGSVTADDAYLILLFYTNRSVGNDSYGFSEDAALETALEAAADVDGNGTIDATDAYYVLMYYAQVSVGAEANWDDLVK